MIPNPWLANKGRQSQYKMYTINLPVTTVDILQGKANKSDC